MLLVVYFLLVQLYLLVSGHSTVPDEKTIDIDYYGKGAVRHTRVKLDCQSDLHMQYCKLKCSRSDFVCIHGNCYCVREEFTRITPHYKEDQLPSSEDSPEEFHGKHYSNNAKNSQELELSRRHHIAHFCPNLEKARQCIRKCMKVGQPAFCGKDHVCYCGHKYGEPVNKWREESIDVKAVYGQFKDLYAKYFPPNPSKKDIDNKSPKPKPHVTTNPPVVVDTSSTTDINDNNAIDDSTTPNNPTDTTVDPTADPPTDPTADTPEPENDLSNPGP